jgi:ABC-type polysaccharide/polyol phosphate export permease
LTTGQYPEPFHLMHASMFLLLVGGLAWYCLRRFERDLVYWI